MMEPASPLDPIILKCYAIVSLALVGFDLTASQQQLEPYPGLQLLQFVAVNAFLLSKHRDDVMVLLYIESAVVMSR